MNITQKVVSTIVTFGMMAVLTVSSFAASTTLQGTANSKQILGSDDNLFVTVTTTYTYTETYTPVNTNNVFSKRTQSFTMETTDKSANITPIASANVFHWTKSGTKVATFTLENQAVIFPSDVWRCAYRIDTTQRIIPQKSTEYGTCSYSFTGSFISGATTQTAKISFNV